jgi:F0F1-type ATP synthase delta subunit
MEINKINNLVITKEQRDNYINKLDQLIESAYTIKSGKRTTANPEANIKELTDVKNYLLKLPMINLTLAFDPSADFLKKLAAWFNKKVILDINIKPKIIAGLIIETNGRHHDLSVKNRLTLQGDAL